MFSSFTWGSHPSLSNVWKTVLQKCYRIHVITISLQTSSRSRFSFSSYTCCVSRRDESNHVVWLATWVGRAGFSCPIAISETTWFVPLNILEFYSQLLQQGKIAKWLLKGTITFHIRIRLFWKDRDKLDSPVSTLISAVCRATQSPNKCNPVHIKDFYFSQTEVTSLELTNKGQRKTVLLFP